MKLRFVIGTYPIKTLEKTVNIPDDKHPLSFSVSNLTIKLGLTPKIPSEENRPLLSISLEKKIVDSVGKNLVLLQTEHTYRLDIEDDFSPSPEEIFILTKL